MEQQSPTNLWKNITADTHMSFPQDAGQLSESSESTIFLDEEDDNPSDISPGVTKAIHKMIPNKKKYHYISHTMRLDLIDAVENKGQKIKSAAKNLGINYSSAKSIYQVYKREGRSDKKTFKRRNYKEECSTQTTSEPNVLGVSIDPTPILSSEITYPLNVVEEDPAEQKDSLMILRDRLLASRAGSTQNLEAYKMSLQKEFPNFYGLAQNQPTITSFTEVKDPQQFEFAKPNLNEDFGVKIPQQQYPVQQINGYSTTSEQSKPPVQSFPNQTFYLIPQQMMTPMMMTTSSQAPSSYNNFNSIGQQNMQFSGPSQTININQPTAKNMSIQTISFPDNKANPMNAYTKESMNQPQMMNAPQMQIPQPQYCSVGFVNPMNPMNPMMNQVNQMNGMQVMPQKVFMFSQGNFMPVNTMPQMIQPNMGYPMYGQNYMSIQANSGYSFGNTQVTVIDQKMRPNMINVQNLVPGVKLDESIPINK